MQVDSSPWLHSEATVHRAVRRYEQFWLPILAADAAEAKEQGKYGLFPEWHVAEWGLYPCVALLACRLCFQQILCRDNKQVKRVPLAAAGYRNQVHASECKLLASRCIALCQGNHARRSNA